MNFQSKISGKGKNKTNHVAHTHLEGLTDFESMAVRSPLIFWEALQSQLIVELCFTIRQWLEQTQTVL